MWEQSGKYPKKKKQQKNHGWIKSLKISKI